MLGFSAPPVCVVDGEDPRYPKTFAFEQQASGA